jgi:F0F1-type ATP synthase delta subunit
MKKNYPGAFPDPKTDLANQQKLIDHTWSPEVLQPRCEAYNTAYQNLWDNWGLDKIEWGRYERAPFLLKEYFKSIDYDFISSGKPTCSEMPGEDWERLDRKMTTANEKVVQIENLLAQLKPELSRDKQTLIIREIEELKNELKFWLFRINNDDDQYFTPSGLPFDSAMMAQVFEDIKSEKHKDFALCNFEERQRKTQEMVDEMWATMYDKVVKYTQPERTEEEFNTLKKVYMEVFGGQNIFKLEIQNSAITELAQVMFLQAFWQGGDKLVYQLEQEMINYMDIYEDNTNDVLELWKYALFLKPDIKLTGELGLWVKALDVAFVPKMLNEARLDFSGANIMRTAHRVIDVVHQSDFDTKMKYYNADKAKYPPVEETKQKLREQMFEFADDVDKLVLTQNTIDGEIENLKTRTEYWKDMPLPTMDQFIETAADNALWRTENDPRAEQIDAFKQKLIAFAKSGKGDIIALENEAKDLLPSSLVSEGNPVSDEDYMQCFVTYVRSKRDRVDLRSLRECYLSQDYRTTDSFLQFVKGKYHPIVVNALKHLHRFGLGTSGVKVFEDYQKVVKVYKGEVHGTITSAEELTDAEFQQILDGLTAQNPGKMFILGRSVDKSLGAGFTVRCGTQTLDYSLRSELASLK